MGSAAGARPGLPTVAVRVYAACLGWGMLTGAVMGAAYLSLSLLLDDKWDGSGGIPVVVGLSYGAPVGLLGGAVLGLGAVAGVLIAASRDRSVRGAAHPGTALTRATWWARAGFLVTAVVVLALWRLAPGSASDNWFEWRLVLVVGVGLLFGTWRAGRAVRRAMSPAGVPVRR